MNKKAGVTNLFVLILIVGAIFFMYKSAKPISIDELTTNVDQYLGEKVTIAGIVKNSFKVGTISGFKLQDKTDEILVASDTLPADDSKLIVRGTVMKEAIIGTYIQAKQIIIDE